MNWELETYKTNATFVKSILPNENKPLSQNIFCSILFKLIPRALYIFCYPFCFTGINILRPERNIRKFTMEFSSKQTKFNDGPFYLCVCTLDIQILLNRHRISWCVYQCTWWRHQMETFSAVLALCAGNSPLTGEFPSQRPVTRSFGVFFDLNKRLSKPNAGDLRRNQAHHDVTVMGCFISNVILRHKRTTWQMVPLHTHPNCNTSIATKFILVVCDMCKICSDLVTGHWNTANFIITGF